MANDNKLVTLEDLGEAYTALYNRDVVTVATQQANGLMSSTDKGKLDGIEAGAQVNPGNATTSAAGLMSADDKTKLNGIEAGAQVNTVTGVKGAAESDYRDGNVSLDAEDVGAISKDMNYTAATLPYANTEKVALLGNDGNNYYTTIGELASQIGGGGGTSQTALVHYVKNCGTISSLNWTNSTIDNNITENMVVLKAELSNPAAQTSDWTCTTTNGYVTISGTISGSTNVLLYFGVSLSTAPSIIVNLASNSSDNVLKTNPTPGVMGVLGPSNGGTGKTSLEQVIKIVRITTSSFDVDNNANIYVSINPTLSGYKAVGIVGITSSGNAGLAYSDFYILSQTDARVYIKNNSGINKIGVTLQLDILYIPS